MMVRVTTNGSPGHVRQDTGPRDGLPTCRASTHRPPRGGPSPWTADSLPLTQSRPPRVATAGLATSLAHEPGLIR